MRTPYDEEHDDEADRNDYDQLLAEVIADLDRTDTPPPTEAELADMERRYFERYGEPIPF